jgi:Flp pilus assembly protein TadD
VASALLLAFRNDPRDDLRAADRLFVAGRFHEALAAYAPLGTALPTAQLRLGMVRAVRGEALAAEAALRAAMNRSLSDGDYHLALLYLGHALHIRERHELALSTWALLEDCRSPAACALRGPGRLLVAEAALQRGAYAEARAALETALALPLPPAWAALARYRLALLDASSSPDAALAQLALPAPVTPEQLLLAPLLPAGSDGAAQLAAVLAAEPEARSQLLGQLYLELGLFGLAETQFALVDPTSPEALSAAAFAAYTRWRAGDVRTGLARLEALVAAHPDEPRARTLLALAYLDSDAEAARAQLDAVADLRPGSANLELAWASWYAARREYAEASLAHERAVLQAPPAERPRFALLAARFHLATTYELCERGLPLAQLAAQGRADDADTQSALAATSYRCGDHVAATDAARAAQRVGAGPEAAYYLGAALAALGDSVAARAALIRAADLAPASIWRERAELALAALP